jgi:MFS family permease
LDLEQQKTQADQDASLPPAELVQSRVEPPKSIFEETVFIAILCMAQLMTQAGLAQAIAPLHIIGFSFGTTNGGQLSWFAAAYSLTVGTFILIAGRLGDVFGHKRLFIAGFLWYALWSLIAGFSVYSKSQIFFDCCRAFQGIGPAFLMPNALAILGRTYEPGRKKEMIFSIFGGCAPGGFVLGAIFSSIFAQFTWWPWAYWVTGIVCAVFAGIGLLIIPKTPSPEIEETDFSMLSRIDAAGSLTGVVGLVLINFAWNQGPIVGWSTPYTYILLIVGCLVITLFGMIESRARFPLLPFDALTLDTGFVLGCIAAGWSSFGIWVFYTWQLQEQLRGISPLLASAQFAPVALSGLCAAFTTGFIISKVPASFVMLCAMLAFTVGGILIATVPVGQIYWAQTFVALLVMPWGM